MRDHVQGQREELIEHFSWLVGLKHSQLANVYDVGMTERRHIYYVREYFPSSELLSLDPSLVMKSLVSIVVSLEKQRRIHGAIKPSNIFVTNETFKLADARFRGFTSKQDEASVHFTAPEILQGGDVSHESDLYSLGAVLYRVLTGRHLFEDSDLNRLKSKYLSASPQPTPYWSPVSSSIAESVLDLLSRTPQKRAVAFERMKATLVNDAVILPGEVFVGRQHLLEELMDVVRKPRETLQVVLLQGEIGVGKSRLLKQLRLRCAFHGLSLVVAQSEETPTVWGAVNAAIRTLPIKGLNSDKTIPLVTVQSSSGHKYPLEKEISDVISALGSVARGSRIILAIDNVELDNAETVVFLEQLAFRASEIPLTLLLTRRPDGHEPSWVRTLDACLGTDILRFHVPILSPEDAEKLVSYLENDRERQRTVLELSAGNPLFIQKYVRSLDLLAPEIKEVTNGMLAKLDKRTRYVLQVLSVFRNSVGIDLVTSLCNTSALEVQTKLDPAVRLGLVTTNGETIKVRFPILRTKLYSSIPRKARRYLNRMAFFALRNRCSDKEALAQYAFESGMFHEAAPIYRVLANDAYESQTYLVAANYYELLQQCCQSSDEDLSPNEKLNLARCYDIAGKQSHSQRVYQDLLSTEGVQKDPELLSKVHIRLARTTRRIGVRDRTRLLERALQCLPNTIPNIRCYWLICDGFVRIGELNHASDVLRRMEECLKTSVTDQTFIQLSRATVLLTAGNFRGASDYYHMCVNGIEAEQGVVLNNLAFCLENLGDLKTALQYQLRAREVAIKSGNKVGQILSLNNIAAIRAKCGDMPQAEIFFNEARSSMRTASLANVVAKDSLFSIVEADTGMYAIYKGDYRTATQCIKNIRFSSGSIFNFDRLLCEIIRCKILIEIGLTTKIRRLLRQFAELSTIFNTDFFQVERTLLEARLPEISVTTKSENLQRALALSENLGTLYQRCELLISMASVHLDIDQKQSDDFAKSALELAKMNDYRILAVRALLLCGLTAVKAQERRLFLSDAFHAASELGLQELMAEAAYHIGAFNLEAGNIVIAREYLIRSTTITARLAEGVPDVARPKYLAKKWRREAVRRLDRCNDSIPLHATTLFSASSDKYFDAAYRLTMAAATTTSLDGLLVSIEKTIVDSFSRAAVVTLRRGMDRRSIPVRIKPSPDLLERIEIIQRRAKNRIYFESDEKGKQFNGWIPLNSETFDGGVYVASRSHEAQFSEKEIELLTMMGTIASNALKRLETCSAQETVPQEITEFHGMIGVSKSMNEVYSQIRMAAGNTATVLIEGESGTGKELVAKAIHAAGPRSKEPFVAVDCGAIPEGLIEAELFGSKKGSYTGAAVDRPGLFEAAHRGSIFLDEISNTTPALQAKLLRVIQEREVRRIGEVKGRPVDVRLIVASNQSLETLVAAGQFRKDLLYRLTVLHIKVPSLQNRSEDIPMLAHVFLKKLNSTNQTKKYFAAGVIERLLTQRFPGNVRELQNAIERGFFLTKGIMITEIPLESHAAAADGPVDEVQTWFKDISEGRKDFWSAIHNRYKRRDISREKVVAFVDFGLRSTRGSYKTMASMFRLKEKGYRRFMDFLRRNECLLDFRPYRKVATASREN